MAAEQLWGYALDEASPTFGGPGSLAMLLMTMRPYCEKADDPNVSDLRVAIQKLCVRGGSFGNKNSIVGQGGFKTVYDFGPKAKKTVVASSRPVLLCENGKSQHDKILQAIKEGVLQATLSVIFDEVPPLLAFGVSAVGTSQYPLFQVHYVMPRVHTTVHRMLHSPRFSTASEECRGRVLSSLLQQVVSFVYQMQKLGSAHRDLKPDNIMYTKTRKAALPVRPCGEVRSAGVKIQVIDVGCAVTPLFDNVRKNEKNEYIVNGGDIFFFCWWLVHGPRSIPQAIKDTVEGCVQVSRKNVITDILDNKNLRGDPVSFCNLAKYESDDKWTSSFGISKKTLYTMQRTFKGSEHQCAEGLLAGLRALARNKKWDTPPTARIREEIAQAC